jgi:hypothetical protein
MSLRKVLGGELGERGGERGGMTSTRRLGADDRRDSALFHGAHAKGNIKQYGTKIKDAFGR